MYDLATGRFHARRWRGPGAARTWPSGRMEPRSRSFTTNKTTSCQIIEAESGKLVRSIPLPSEGERVAWSPDGTTLATPCNDRKIYLWDAATGIRRATPRRLDQPRLACGLPPRRNAAGQQRLGRAASALGPGPGPARAELDQLPPGLSSARTDGSSSCIEDQLTPYQVDPALEYRTFAHASRSVN